LDKDRKKQKPVVAPGDDTYLNKDASKKEIKKRNYTKVVTLSYDEVDPSKE